MGRENLISRLWLDKCGGVAKLFGLTLPLVLLAGGAMVDFTHQTWVNARLQSLADGAALAGAHELALSKRDPAHIQNTVARYVSERRRRSGETGQVNVEANVAAAASGVTVAVSTQWSTSFSQLLGADKPHTSALATAQVVGNTKICALGLMESAEAPGIELGDHARISASDCGVYSNSESAASIKTSRSAQLAARVICAAGGSSVGLAGSLRAASMTECAKIADPLAQRRAPAVGSCLQHGLVVERSTVLFPGTYCGGITIKGKAWVAFQPGVYVIKDGPLRVEDEAEVDGKQVAFHLDGKAAVFSFAAGTKVNLAAPKAGALAGLLFYEASPSLPRPESSPVTSSLMEVLNIPASKSDHFDQAAKVHHISSSSARHLLGTIYLPKSRLVIDADGPVADKSAYTAIVARNLKLQKRAHLVLNTEYGATDVPVPRLIAGGDVRLSE